MLVPSSIIRTLIRHGLFLCAFFIAGIVCHAQKSDSSLTKDFPKLSAKERSRIAVKEAEESKKDDQYQAAMQQAERSFQEGRYEEALADYEKARALRPYNVYPKVKIEDLRTLLAKQTPPADTVTSVAQVVPPPVRMDTVKTPPPPVPKDPVPTPKIIEPVAVPVVREKGIEPKKVERPIIMDRPKATLPDGTTERRYQDGHAFVIERTITEEGHAVVYKRVFHNWGKVFYFEDGVAVDERVWKERFDER